MLHQQILSVEASFADRAVVRSQVEMSSLVVTTVTYRRKLFHAIGAIEGKISGVNAHMDLKVSFL